MNTRLAICLGAVLLGMARAAGAPSVLAQGSVDIFLPVIARNDNFLGATGALVIGNAPVNDERVRLMMPATGGSIEWAVTNTEPDGRYWLVFTSPLRENAYSVQYDAPMGTETTRIASASLSFEWPADGNAVLPDLVIDPVLTLSPRSGETIECSHVFQWDLPPGQYENYVVWIQIDPIGPSTSPSLVQPIRNETSMSIDLPCGTGVGDFHLGDEYEWRLTAQKTDGTYTWRWQADGGSFWLQDR